MQKGHCLTIVPIFGELLLIQTVFHIHEYVWQSKHIFTLVHFALAQCSTNVNVETSSKSATEVLKAWGKVHLAMGVSVTLIGASLNKALFFSSTEVHFCES